MHIEPVHVNNRGVYRQLRSGAPNEGSSNDNKRRCCFYTPPPAERDCRPGAPPDGRAEARSAAARAQRRGESGANRRLNSGTSLPDPRLRSALFETRSDAQSPARPRRQSSAPPPAASPGPTPVSGQLPRLPHTCEEALPADSGR